VVLCKRGPTASVTAAVWLTGGPQILSSRFFLALLLPGALFPFWNQWQKPPNLFPQRVARISLNASACPRYMVLI